MNPRSMSGINDDNEGINARSMSGINHSSGDVYLNGDPNAFTGTNTFNVNRPTSTITTTPGSTDFITKQNADALYTGAGSGGDVTKAGTNAFTGTNTFNVNRPTSTVATTPGSTDFITTQNADALYAPISVNGDVTEAGTNAFTGTNTFNTNRPTSTVATTPSSTDLITKQNADALYAPISVNGDVTESGDNDFTGANTFNTSRPTSTLATTPSNNDFITKRDGDILYQTGTPTNMATTNTTQTLTGNQTINGYKRVKVMGDEVREINQTKSAVLINDVIFIGGSVRSNGVYNAGELHMGTVDSKIVLYGAGNKIGVGTISPQFPLHITSSTYGSLSGVSPSTYYTYMRYSSSGVHRANNWHNDYFSASFSQAIKSDKYTLASDRRIKKNINDISGATEIINKLKPISYEYIDPKKKLGIQYGFIAQDLEEHLPTIVSTTNDKIPNILKTADVSNEIFTLQEATNLQVEDNIIIYDEEDYEHKVKITEVIDDKNFKVDDDKLKDKYFIYGKEVNDFKTINTDCLTAIMMKSIQELTARVKELEEKCV